MKTITQSDLIELLLRIRGAQPVNISALIDARTRKTGNPFAEVAKLSVVNGFTGFDYEDSVNRQRTREESQSDFSAQGRTWGKTVSPALVEHKGSYYIRLKVERCRKPMYMVKRIEGDHWNIVSRDTIADFLPPYRKAVNQGLDREVTYRNYAVSNIVSLSANGEKYRVRR